MNRTVYPVTGTGCHKVEQPTRTPAFSDESCEVPAAFGRQFDPRTLAISASTALMSSGSVCSVFSFMRSFPSFYFSI
jgi:hypothetical protein